MAKAPKKLPVDFAHTIIAKALIDQTYKKTENYAEKIKELLTPAVDGFFRDLAEHYMGVEEDIFSLIEEDGDNGAGFLTLGHYKDLSADYVRRKGSLAFWVYQRAPGPTAIRRAQGRTLKRVSLKNDDGTLINTFKALSGVKMLGAVQTEVKQLQFARSRPITYSNRGEASRGQRVFETRDDLNPKYDSKYVSTRFTIAISLWGNLKGNRGRPEYKLFEPAMHNTYLKLMNRLGSQRPLILPFLSFYSNTVLPALIADYISLIPGARGEKIKVNNSALL